MKRFSSTIVILLSLIAGAWMTIQVWPHMNWLTLASFESQLTYENIHKAVSDEQQNVFTVDRSLKRVMRMDPQGTVGFLLEEPYASPVNYGDVAVDRNGHIYVALFKMNAQGVRIEYERINQYDTNGQYLKTVYEIRYNPKQLPTRPAQISGLAIRGDALTFYRTQNTNVSAYQVGTKGGPAKLVSELTIPQGLYPFHFSTMAGDQSVYFTTKRAEIYRYQANGAMAKLYPPQPIDGDATGSAMPSQTIRNADGKIAFPLYLTTDPANRLYVADIGLQQVSRLEPITGIQSPVLTEAILKANGYDISLKSMKNLSVQADGGLSIATGNRVILLDREMKLKQVIESGQLTGTQMWPRWLVRLQALAVILLVGLIFYMIYAFWMQRRISLMVKQLAFFVPVILAVILFVSWMINAKYTEIYKQELFNKLKLTVHTGTQMLDVPMIESIKQPADFMGPAWQAVDKTNKFMLRGADNLDTDAYYSAIYKIDQDQAYVLMYFNTSVGTYYPINMMDVQRRVLEKGTIETEISKEADGEWVFAMGPVRNQQGKIVALHEVGTNLTNLAQLEQEIMNATWQVIQWVVPAIIIFYLLLTLYILGPLRDLRSKVMEVARGNWHVNVAVRSSDEVADVSGQFNVMAEKIRNYIEEVEQISEASFRFVPQQIMNDLKKKSILDLQLGDHVQHEMTLMMFRVRDFFTITQGMDAKRNFEFIKRILGHFGPVIPRHMGYVSTYLADGAMCLFTQSTETAVCAALEIRSQLNAFNEELEADGLPRIELSIAIHTGSMMLGIIGEEKRLVGSVVSEDVNRLTLIQQQTEAIGSAFVLTGQAFLCLPKQDQFLFRSLGLVQLPGIAEPMQLYDFFEGDESELKKMKVETRVLFERAIEWFQEGRYYDARKAFLSVIKQNRYDLTAKLYFYLCDQYVQQGSPDDAIGVLKYENRTT